MPTWIQGRVTAYAADGITTPEPVCAREASEDGEYEEAFWLCAEASRALADVRQLPVAAQLAAAVDEAYAEATVGLQLALQSVCTGFRAERYAKVSSIARQSHACAACTLGSSGCGLLP